MDDEYFLVTSSFTYFPGVPIFHSRNLVDWRQVGNVLDRPDQLDLTRTTFSSMGIFAPTLRHHDDKFWMITTVVTDLGSKNFLVTATDPAGPWSEATWTDAPGIDPDLAWDDDGNCWLHSSSDGIVRCRIDEGNGQLLDGPVPTWSGTGLQYPEGPHLFQREGVWYLLIAEGGTQRGHAVSVARGPSPTGPWESCPQNPILSHRSTDRPIQNTGHADFVDVPDGSWWMVLLGVRPQGFGPGFSALGRETFLAPVEWIDDWPVIGKLELEMTCQPPGPGQALALPGRDDFDGTTLAPYWISVRRPPADVASLVTRPGWLTVQGTEASLDDPGCSFVGRRQQHHRFTVRASLDSGDRGQAGIALRMDEHAHYEVAVVGEEIVVSGRIGPFSQVFGRTSRPSGPVRLRIEAADGGMGQPDCIRLGMEDVTGRFYAVAEIDGCHLSPEIAGGFLGRVIGMFAVGGDAAFDWFDYQVTT